MELVPYSYQKMTTKKEGGTKEGMIGGGKQLVGRRLGKDIINPRIKLGHTINLQRKTGSRKLAKNR